MAEVSERPTSRGLSLLAVFFIAMVLCLGSDGTAPLAANQPTSDPAITVPNEEKITPTLREVGTRGFFTLFGSFAEFDRNHHSVEVWTPPENPNAPIMVYAHGGAGLREDDRARVEMFRRNGFATLSFDAYLMNGFEDWNFVTRRIANQGKQAMIWGVFKGAIEYAATQPGWDSDNIILYGGSNGGRVVLYAGSEMQGHPIRGIISEAPAGSGYELGDYNISTIIPFGALDTWAGKSDSDFVWQRTYPGSKISIESWVNSQREKGHPVEFVFYQDAGHLLFDGPLEKVTVRRGNAIAFTSYRGAAEGVLEQYEKDTISFARRNIAK